MSTCIIPARGGSRRIPRKNIRDFCGKPIIAYSIDTALKVFDQVIVSTDDDEIARVARDYGARTSFRTAGMCMDEVGTQEVMAFVLKEQLDADEDELYCCMYPCAPMVTKDDLDKTLWQLLYITGPYSYVVSVAADPLRDIGNFYVGRAFLFMNMEPLYTKYTQLYVMPTERAIDINTEEDWLQAEEMYKALHP